MGCDMVAALGSATAHGHTLVGVNLFASDHTRLTIRRWPASSHSPDEIIQTGQIELPQVRQTCAVLGVQPERAWGLAHGCNQHQVVMGAARWHCRPALAGPGLTGPDLVRLTLERCHTALNAVEILTDLISRHRHGCNDSAAGSVFLIADVREAYVLEAAGSCWSLQECQETRAVSDVAMIRQDWKRLSPGLAEHAIQEGWWRDDGTKLDFAGSLGKSDPEDAWPLRRWGKATLALAQQSGSLQVERLRRLLLDHFDLTSRGHASASRKMRLLANTVFRLEPGCTLLAWFATGAAPRPLFFPLAVDADLPEAWSINPPAFTGENAKARALAERLQALFDQDAEDLLLEARALCERGERGVLSRLAQAMMQKHLEQWHAECAGSAPAAPMAKPRPRPEEEEAVPFAFG